MKKDVRSSTIFSATDGNATDKRRQLHQKMRAYNTDMSDFARLFQRVVLRGDETHAARLKTIIKNANQQIIELLKDIEK